MEWCGDQKNAQLQRIYGTAWPTREELVAYKTRLEEAARRDHRKLGAELDLFSFPEEIGPGLVVFHPKGGIIKREMEDYVRRRHVEEGFWYVGTPHITKRGLFETSGHLPYYEDTMFPAMRVDEERDAEGNIVKEGQEYFLKAMNCPMHNLIYRSQPRSYRDLPLRLFEFGTVYRYEKSGVVQGLTRVRGLTQDDSHTYCTPEQAPGEIRMLLTFILGLLRDFGLHDFYLELSTRGKAANLSGATRTGRTRRVSCAPLQRSPAWNSCLTRVERRSTGQRFPCRRVTRSAGPGKCRRSSTTSTNPSGSAWSTWTPIPSASARS